MTSDRPNRRGRPAAISTALVLTLAVQSAVPPFGTDTYTPAFPQVSEDLGAAAALVGLTLTLFFAGFGAGQLIGGPMSDRFGRRRPMIVGGVVCTLGAIGCALAPSIGVLIAFRLVQGIGGGVAAAVARAVIVDVARGDALAKVMSALLAIAGLAPAVAPVIGGLVLTFGGTWRVVFWVLVGFGLLMTVTAARNVPETLPKEARHGGGLGAVVGGFGSVLRERRYVLYTVTASLSTFTLIAYVSDAAYVLQGMRGMAPLPYALFFASTALAQVLVSLINVRIVSRFGVRRLIGAGLTTSLTGVLLVATSVLLLGIAVPVLCAGFLLVMASQGLIFGNASALAAGEVRQHAGSAAGVSGVMQSLAMSISAPLATLGGTATAMPIVIVMGSGILLATCSYLVAGRTPRAAVA